MNLEQQMEKAFLRIDNGNRKPVIVDVSSSDDDDPEDTFDYSRARRTDSNLIIRQPQNRTPTVIESRTKTVVPVAQPTLPAEFNVLPILSNLTSHQQNDCMTRALQAEVAFKALPQVSMTLEEREITERVFSVSAVIQTEIAKFKRTLQWKRADAESESKRVRDQLDKALSSLDKRLFETKAIDKQEVSKLASQWLAVVDRFDVVLGNIEQSLSSFCLSKDQSIVRETVRSASQMLSTLHGILRDNKVKVLSTATTSMDVIQTLRHAIDDSIACVQSLMQDAIGQRPEYDEERHRQLHHALSDTRADLLRVSSDIRDAEKSLGDEHTDEFELQTRLRSLKSRLEKSRNLEAMLAKDLCDTEVQRSLKKLLDVCNTSTAWYQASKHLSEACRAKHTKMADTHAMLAKERLIEEGLAHEQLQRSSRHIASFREEGLSALRAVISKELGALQKLQPSTVSHMERLIVLKNNLHARVALEYTMLL